MSDINGKGYGDCHDWQYKYSTPFKTSLYQCARCRANFQHNYDDVPDIFQAMQQMKVPAECQPQAMTHLAARKEG